MDIEPSPECQNGDVESHSRERNTQSAFLLLDNANSVTPFGPGLCPQSATNQCEIITSQESLRNKSSLLESLDHSTSMCYASSPDALLSGQGLEGTGSGSIPSKVIVQNKQAQTMFVKKETESPELKGIAKPIDSDWGTDQQERLFTGSPQANEKMRSAHNIIEQRYRNKINDKFLALQHSVPTLRAALNQRSGYKASEDAERSSPQYHSDSSESLADLEGLQPATKLNKGTILAKTVEYIKFLESKHENLMAQYQQLSDRAELLGLQVNDESEIE